MNTYSIHGGSPIPQPTPNKYHVVLPTTNRVVPNGTDVVSPGPLLHFRADARGLAIATANASMRVNVLADDLLRFRTERDGQDELDVSWAVVKEDWPPVRFAVSETETHVELETARAVVRIRRSDAAVTVTSARGVPILQDAALRWDSGTFRMAWTQPAERRIYGCGEKAGSLDRRGQPMVMWNTDQYSYERGWDPLYQSLPFALGMDGGETHGLFVDNTFLQTWDMGAPGETGASVQADGGVADVYVFSGGTPRDVLARYTELTGRMALPPLWALGYQQSRYSYYPEAQVRETAAEFRARSIPCDVLYLDIHYMDRFKDFTWDAARFPDPKGMVDALRTDGFQTVVILDPGIKVEPGYAPYEELLQSGRYVKNPDGSPFVGPVWPGDCLFPDFTDPKCRAWWGGLYRDLTDTGIAGFWNDMNEPAVFGNPEKTMPPDTQFQGDGILPDTHRRYHNVYGAQMARATLEGIQRLRPAERPFVLARAAYAGAQRYAATWTGDNMATWDHVRLSIPMVLNLGLSGQAMSGPDVGGFIGDPTPEMFGRWLQCAALMPFCRTHSAKADFENLEAEGFTPQEPWVFGEEWERINRESIELRYRLLPYLYTVVEEMTRTGAPVMRPLFWEYPDDPHAHNRDNQFLLGRDILAAPVVEEGATRRALYLPDGAWYDFWTDELLSGGREITVDAPPHKLPLYVRAGAALPMQPVVQHTGACDGQPIQWRAYLDGNGADGALYEDDGRSLEFQNGQFRRTRLSVTRDGDGARVETAADGPYVSPRPAPECVVVGLPGGPRPVRLDPAP